MNIADAWQTGHRTCFLRLIEYTQSKENVTAFDSFLPGDRDCWAFYSGGLAVEQVGRFQGANPVWCSLPFAARIDAVFQQVADAREFAGKVLNFLKETTNLQQVGNVAILRLSDLPQTPELVPVDDGSGRLVWAMTIPLEMVLMTETEYSA